MYFSDGRLCSSDGFVVASRVGNILQINVWDGTRLLRSVCIHRDAIKKYALAIYDYLMHYGTTFLDLEDFFPELGDIPCVFKEDDPDPTDDGVIDLMCKDCMKESCVGCDIINYGHKWYPED